MQSALTAIMLALLLFSGPANGSEASLNVAANAELSAMFEADQAIRKDIRQEPTAQNVQQMIADDLARQTRVKAILAADEAKAGIDFYHAAFIMQHGQTAENYLLAHALAIVALSKGYEDANWIAAATLDRYLQASGQPQIFVTQSQQDKDGKLTQEPYDRQFVSNEMRSALNVPLPEIETAP